MEITKYRRTTEEYITTLKECIIVRDEQVEASQLQELVRQKDMVIEETKEKIAKGKAKIAELQEKVHRLMGKMDNGAKSNEMHKSKKRKAQSKYVYKKFEQIYGGQIYERHYITLESPC